MTIRKRVEMEYTRASEAIRPTMSEVRLGMPMRVLVTLFFPEAARGLYIATNPGLF